ncbi:hypothetical protein ACFY4C_23570 [Actinomadura viridis]|uniref:hypothetical protein n=1 Tax=Actinomadura viridis TaxID=58110 RepID=UPI0036996A0C
MTEPPEPLKQLRIHPFRSMQAHRLGVSTGQLRSKQFRHMLYDVYAWAGLPDSMELRCDAAALVLPESAVFCGVTAARLYGIPVPDGDQRIHVAVPSTSSTVPRVKPLKIHSYSIPHDHVGTFKGHRLVGPARLFLELAAALPRIDLIVAGDHMLRHRLTTERRISDFIGLCRRRRGVRKAKDALPLLEERSDSPPETRLRMLIVDAGLPRPVANQDVFNDWGLWLARPDLSYPGLKIAIEYEGAHHQEDYTQYASDIERDGRLLDHGWIVIRVNKEGLFRTPTTVINRIKKARASRLPRR